MSTQASDTRTGRVGPALCVPLPVDVTEDNRNYQWDTVSGNFVTAGTNDFPTFALTCGAGASAGVWYFEIELLDGSAPHVGALLAGKYTLKATTKTKGVGNDGASWAHLGSKGYFADKLATGDKAWAKGEIVGVTLDLTAKTMTWTRNNALVATADFAGEHKGFYAEGDTLVPAVSLPKGCVVAWRLAQDSLKFPNPAAAALQAGAVPAFLVANVKAPEAGDGLSDTYDVLPDLLASLARGTGDNADKAAVKPLFEARSAGSRGALEYGWDYAVTKTIAGYAAACAAAYKGDGLELKGGAFSNGEDAKKKAGAMVATLRAMLQRARIAEALYLGAAGVAAFAAAARDAADAAVPLVEEAWGKAQLLAALEDRKTHKFADFGFPYYATNKVRSDITKGNAAALTTHGENVRMWRKWFLAQYTGSQTVKELVLAALGALVTDCLGEDPDAAELAAAANAAAGPEGGVVRNSALSVPAQPEQPAVLDKLTAMELAKLATLSKEVFQEMDKGDKERDRFPERCEESYRKAAGLVAPVEKRAAAFVAALEKNCGRVTKVMIASGGVGSLVDTPEYNAFLSAFKPRYEAWAQWQAQHALNRKVDLAMRDVLRELGQGKDKVAHSNPEAALQILSAATRKLDALRKEPGFWSAATVATQMAEADALRAYITVEAPAVMQRQAAGGVRPKMSTAVSVMNKCVSVNDFDGALKAHKEASSLLEQCRTNKDWIGVPSITQAVQDFGSDIDGFMDVYKNTFGKNRAEALVREITSTLTGARDFVSHNNFDRALQCLTQGRALATALREDPIVGTHPVAASFLPQYFDDAKTVDSTVQAALIDRQAAAAARELGSALTNAKDGLEHSNFDAALKAIAAVKRLAGELEANERLRGNAATEAALLEVDTAVPALEERYKSTMIFRQLADDKRVAESALAEANNGVEHSNYDKALKSMQQYKAKVVAMEAEEQYRAQTGTAGDVDAYVANARNVAIPDWQSKYEAKYLGRLAQNIARELSSKATAADDHFEHNRYDSMLERLTALRKQIRALADTPVDAEDDTALAARLSAVQDAISQASTSAAALEAKYAEAAQARLLADGRRDAESALSLANDKLGHANYDAALEAFSQARGLATQLALKPEGASAAAATFLETFDTLCATFREKYSAAVSSRDEAAARRDIATALSFAKQNMSHCKGDQALAELRKAKGLIAAFEAAHKNATADPAWATDAAAVESDYATRVLGRLADELTGKAASQVASARRFLEHSNPDAALTALSAARTAAADLAAESRIAQLPKVVAFNASFSVELKDVSERYAAFQTTKKGNELARVLQTLMIDAANFISHSRFDEALVHAQNALTARDELKLDSDLAAVPAVVSVLTEAETRVPALLAEYREKVGAKKLAAGIREIRDSVAQATDALGHSRLDDAQRGLLQTRDLVGALSGDPVFAESPELDAFLKEYTSSTRELSAALESKRADRLRAQLEREVTTAIAAARDHLGHNRNDRALEALRIVRTAVAACEGELGAAGALFVADQRTAMVAFEADFTEKAFAAEVRRKIDRAQALLGRACNALDKHCVDESLKLLSEAREASALLGGDERFLNTPSVVEFMTRFVAELQAHKSAIATYQASRAADTLQRTAESLLTDMRDKYSHSRIDEALTSLRRVERMLETDLAAPAHAALKADVEARALAFRAEYQNKHLRAQAQSTIRAANSLLETARFHGGHNRLTDAMSALGEAQVAALALNEPEFAGLDIVESFFETWGGRVAALKGEVQGVLVSQSVAVATHKIADAFAAAEQCLLHHNYDFALVHLTKAGTAMAELKADTQLAALPAVVAALSDATARKSALGTTIADTVFAKEVAAVVRTAGAHLVRAKTLFARLAFDDALSALSNAKATVAAAAANESLAGATAFKAYMAEFKSDAAAFAAQFAATALADEARAVAREVSTKAAQAKMYLDRLIEDKAASALAEAHRAAVRFMNADEPLSLVPIAAETVAALKTVQQAFAEQFLAESVADAVASARDLLGQARKAEQRALPADKLYTDAFAAVAPLLGPGPASPVAFSVAGLPFLVTFVTGELLPAAEARGIDLFASASAGTLGGAGGAVTFDSMLGDRFPGKAVLQKGLVRLQKGPELDPAFFRYCDASDVVFKRAQNGFRGMVEAIKTGNMTLEAESVRLIETAHEGTRDLLLKFMDGDAKVNTSEHYKNIRAAYEAYIPAHAALEKQFNRRVALFKLLESIRTRMVNMNEVADFNQNNLNPYYKVERDFVHYKAARDAVALIKEIRHHSANTYNGFVNEDTYVEHITAILTKLCKNHTYILVRLAAHALQRRDVENLRCHMAKMSSWPNARAAAWARVERLFARKVSPLQGQFCRKLKPEFKLDGSTDEPMMVDLAEWHVDDARNMIKPGTNAADAAVVARGRGRVYVEGEKDESAMSTLDAPVTFKASSFKSGNKNLVGEFSLTRSFADLVYETDDNGCAKQAEDDFIDCPRYVIVMYARVNGENIVGHQREARALECFLTSRMKIHEAKHLPFKFKFPLLRYNKWSVADDTFSRGDYAFSTLLSQLSQGTYEIELDMAVVRDVSIGGSAIGQITPCWPSEPSVPLSRTRFVLELDTAMPQKGALFPPLNGTTDAKLASECLLAIRASPKFKKAHPVRLGAVNFTTGFYPYVWDSIVVPGLPPSIIYDPAQFTRDMRLTVQRSLADGWSEDLDEDDIVEYLIGALGGHKKVMRAHFVAVEEIIGWATNMHEEVLPRQWFSEADLAIIGKEPVQ